MPIYTFKCDDCKIIIEKLLKFKDKKCPVCKNCNKKMRKVLSVANFRFKGFIENNKGKVRDIVIKE